MSHTGHTTVLCYQCYNFAAAQFQEKTIQCNSQDF